MPDKSDCINTYFQISKSVFTKQKHCSILFKLKNYKYDNFGRKSLKVESLQRKRKYYTNMVVSLPKCIVIKIINSIILI